MLAVKALSVGCGEAYHIRFKGEDDKFYNILIDGGTEKGDIYEKTLQKEIQDICNNNELIDMWVISHIDDDHIGGILRFIKDTDLSAKVDLSKTTFWYNYSTWDYDIGIRDTNQKSVHQGMLLRDYLFFNTELKESISDTTTPINYYGLNITVLSPSSEKLKKLKVKWKKEEVKIRIRRYKALKKAHKNDYLIKIEDFDTDRFQEDNRIENGSSIALMLTYHGETILLLADSHPSIIVDSLKRLGYSETNRLKVRFITMPHHGSKYNINNELLRLIDGSNYLICADGYGNNLPNKESLARVIHNNHGKDLSFHITHRNDATTSIFSVDGPLPNISLNFPNNRTNGIIIEIP